MISSNNYNGVMVANTFDAVVKNLAVMMMQLNERKETLDKIIRSFNAIPKATNNNNDNKDNNQGLNEKSKIRNQSTLNTNTNINSSKNSLNLKVNDSKSYNLGSNFVQSKKRDGIKGDIAQIEEEEEYQMFGKAKLTEDQLKAYRETI